MNKLIALVGLCGSGKTSSIEFFRSKGFKEISVDFFVDRELSKKNLDDSELNRRNMRNELKTLYGKDALVSLLFDEIDLSLEKGNVILDGLYSWDEYVSLKNKYNKNLIVVHIFSLKRIRYSRLEKRLVRPISRDNAEKRDLNEIENLNKGGPVAFADYVIINNSDINNLHSEINKFLLQLN